MSLFKKIFAFAVILTAFSHFSNAQQRDTLRVLCIGNSFSSDAMDQDLWGVADADGQPLVSALLYIGGSDIKGHLQCLEENAASYELHKTERGVFTVQKGVRADDVLRSRPWDVVVFQQQSAQATDFSTIDPYLGKVIKYVKKRVPKGVRLMWHQTWAYDDASWAMQNGVPFLEQYAFRGIGMYRDIVDASRRICEKYKLDVIPAGTAIQCLRTGYTMENTSRDARHLSLTIGRYAAACTWYEALTGRSTEGNSYVPCTLRNPIRRASAQQAAHYACTRPYEVTSMYNGGGSYKSLENGFYHTDEKDAACYVLPDPLTSEDGTKVTTPEQWNSSRRGEIMEVFKEEVYGRGLEGPMPGQHYKVLEENDNVFGGLATRKQVAIYFTEKEDDYMVLLLYTPNQVDGPAPAFLYMNLIGTEGMLHDLEILPPDANQIKRYGRYGIPAKGQNARRVPIEMILDRGYAYATFYKGDLDPDFDDGFRNGIHKYTHVPGERFQSDNAWGSIGVWAWGMSRALDYLETDADVDAARVSTIGHSRGGKTALWAAAQDQRFAMAVSNCSGCTGAALSRRKMGETVRAIQVTFPHWFCTNYLKYMDNEDALPVDQHELIALIAPRPVYVASASRDFNADPRGEFLGLKEASCVYRLFGFEGFADDAAFPEVRGSVSGERVGYHLREGKHDILAFDWQHYLDFADKYLK